MEDIERLAKTPGYRVTQGPENRTIFLGMDVASPELKTSDVKGKNPFKDVRVRRAVYHAIDLNFRLKPGSKAVDAAVRLPTVNEDFAGSAPDLGALEVGKAEPVYGPRRGVKQPFYR